MLVAVRASSGVEISQIIGAAIGLAGSSSPADAAAEVSSTQWEVGGK